MGNNKLPLESLLVVDESYGPMAGLATMVLADFGADVIKLEPPGGDPERNLASARLWLRGKRSLMLDGADKPQQQSLLRLAERADVWVRGPKLLPQALSDDELVQANPKLILAWVSAFGRTGPYANYPAHEALVAAKWGRMLQFRGLPSRDGPAYSALQVATHAASQSLLSGILAAVHARERDGVGQILETSLLRGLLAYEMGSVLGVQVEAQRRARGEPESPPVPDPAVALPTLNYHPLRTKDGRWLQMGNLLPHLFMNFVRAAGLEKEFDQLGVSGPTALWPEDKRESFRDLMLERLQQKPLDEWQQLFVEDGGVASHPYQTTEQAFDDPDLIANGHSLPLGDDGRQLGLLANLTRTPGKLRRRAPEIGEHTAELLAELALNDAKQARFDEHDSVTVDALPDSSSPHSTPQHSTPQHSTPPRVNRPAIARRKPPLDGVTVVEAATIIAAPFAAALLADLGARVIKFEPAEGDPFRGMAPGWGAARVNTGKECIGLDLKQPAAQEIARKLVAKADIFIHNYRPGVPERLGLGYPQLSAANPRLVYISANGYGAAGPGALRPSTHPIPGAALGGVLHQIGGEPDTRTMTLAELRETARRLMRANDVNPDPNTSLVICSAALIGLQAQRRLGTGQAIFVDMFGANAWANFDDALRYPGKPPRISPDREGFGLNPLWRLYRCTEGWVFVAIGNPDDWQRFVSVLGESGGMGAISSTGATGDHSNGWLSRTFAEVRNGGAEAIAALEAVFATARAADWEARLATQGVGCVRADSGLPEHFLLNDPHAQAEELMLSARHGEWGSYLRHGAQVVFHGTPGVYRGTSLHGEHTGSLLFELGLGAAEVERLRQAGTVI